MTNNHTDYKTQARAIMDSTTPTIFMAALIGVGIPILIGWMTGGEGDVRLNFNLDAAMLDPHNLTVMFRSVWGQLVTAVGALLLSFAAVAALLTGLLLGGVKALFTYGFIDYTLRVTRGDVGAPRDTLVGFRRPVRILTAYYLKRVIIWAGTVCFIIPGILAAYSLRMTDRVLADHPELGPVDCLRMSHQLMRGHRLDLFGLDISFLGWGILEALTRQISGIYSRTYQTLAENLFYTDLCILYNGEAEGLYM